jgi:hypothetical protein
MRVISHVANPATAPSAVLIGPNLTAGRPLGDRDRRVPPAASRSPLPTDLHVATIARTATAPAASGVHARAVRDAMGEPRPGRHATTEPPVATTLDLLATAPRTKSRCLRARHDPLTVVRVPRIARRDHRAPRVVTTRTTGDADRVCRRETDRRAVRAPSDVREN